MKLEKKLNKKKFFLKTSMIRTPNETSKIYYLGRWCLNFSDYIKKKNYILKYPYDKISLKDKHNRYINKLYYKIEKPLFLKLNKIHNLNKPVKYWRIILKVYLYDIISELFEKWTCIESTKNKKTKYHTEFFDYKFKDFLFIDHKEMDDLKEFEETKYWNHFCYSLIVKEFKHIKYKILKKPKINIRKSISEAIYGKLNQDRNLKVSKFNLLLKLISKYILLFKKNVNLLFLDTYNLRKDVILFLRLKQIYHKLILPEAITSNYSKNIRNWTIEYKTSNKFEKFISKKLPKILPTIYLEGYKKNIDNINNLRNIKPKFSFHLPGTNSIKKIFIAEKKYTKIITAQHGGNYGQLKIYPDETSEIENSDYFLTFGWDSKFLLKDNKYKLSKKKIVKTTALNIGKSKLYNINSKKILIVVNGFRDGFQNFISAPLSVHDNNYDELLVIDKLIENLNDDLKNKIILKFRFRNTKRFNQVSEYFKKKYSDIEIFNNDISLFQLYKYSKISIVTYTGTSYLESIRSEVPTLIYWNKNFTEMRSEYNKYLVSFKKNKFYHSNYLSLSKFVNKNYNNIDIWWSKLNKDKKFKNFIKYFVHYDPKTYYNQFTNILSNQK